MSRGLPALLRLTLVSPRQGLRRIYDLDLPPGTAFTLLALAAVMTAMALHLLGYSAEFDFSDEGRRGQTFALDFGGPVATALVQLGLMAVFAQIVLWGGRMQGGQGTLDRAVMAVAWLEIVMLVVQVTAMLVLIAIFPVIPAVSGLFLPGLAALFFWLLTGFVAEVHGFTSAAKVFGAIIVTFFCFLIIATMVLGALIGPEALHNV